MDEISRPGQQDEDNSANRGFELVDRRRLVWTALAAGTGAAVAGSLAEPAAAANGSPALLGKTNSASATTTVTTTSGVGLLGRSSASGGAGVRGEAAAGYGAVALTSAAGYAAVLGRNTSTASGGFGVRGITTKGEGVRGESPDSNGKGVSGRNNATTGGIGTYGFSSGSSGYGVYGDSTASFGTGTYGRGYNGVEGHSTGFGAGVLGTTDVDSSAVRGEAPNGTGVRGIGGRWGVYGQCTADSGIGVYGTASGNGAVAVFAAATGTATALYADGSAHVQGNLGVSGTLSKGGGSFKIDHPLDPANKYLYHSFVESPDMTSTTASSFSTRTVPPRSSCPTGSKPSTPITATNSPPSEPRHRISTSRRSSPTGRSRSLAGPPAWRSPGR